MAAPATSPDQWLRHADRLLREPALLSDGLWPRTCVWIIRLALEHALDEYWAQHFPEVGTARRRSQLIVLTCTVNADVGRRCSYLWHTLSNAAHHHAYELAPTATELRSWHAEATTLIASRETWSEFRPRHSPEPDPEPRGR